MLHHHGVSADVSLPAPPHCFFVSSHGRPASASVVLRVDSMDDDEEIASSSPSARDILARESAGLHELQRRFSVRDLASKFEKGQAAAEAAVEKLSADMRLSQAAYLDQQSLLQNLREVLEALRGRVAGSNKDDAEEALTTVDALSLQLSQRDAELAQEKSEVRKLAALFKQASDDTKKMVEEAKSIAQAEIEAARESTQRMEEALEEREKFYGFLSQQELEDMRKEVQEARRIKMLHESSKVMDMEHELEGLRQQLVQKTVDVMNLRKEVSD